MRILSVTAGAAGMYCGSCLRDNALAAELMARGHDVTLRPLSPPPTPANPTSARARVFSGALTFSLHPPLAFSRPPPRFLDRLGVSPAVIGALASRSISTDPKLLGGMTVSMLE